MTLLPNSLGRVNKIDSSATKARLKVTLFETLHIALRQKQTDVQGVIRRLKDENAYNEVPFLEAVGGQQ